MEFWGAIGSWDFGVVEVGGVDRIDCVWVDWDEEARNREGNQSNNDENQSAVLNITLELRNIGDYEIDDRDCGKSDGQLNQKWKKLN